MNGAPDRFTTLYRRHHGVVYVYCARRTTPELARDATSETFLVAWRRLPDLPAGRELPWLLRTASNVLRDQARSSRRQDRVAGRLAGGPTSIARDHAGAVAEAADVLAVLRTLSEDDQELLRLSAWDDLDARTIAHILNTSTGAVRVRLHRARRRFAAALAQHSAAADTPAVPLTAPQESR